MMANEVNIHLPVAFPVDDYHEIPVVRDNAVALTGDTQLQAIEVKAAPHKENVEGQIFYWGLLYKGEKPNEDDIIKALEKASCAVEVEL